MDETTKQCVQQTRTPQPAIPGHPARYDAEYRRNGVGHLLMYYAPFEDWRRTDVAANHAGRRGPKGCAGWCKTTFRRRSGSRW
ncbi:MAG: hypothetical protein OXQ31_24525 [Spirochaetaceae bacterium]|nr:hypothetical protein [Spirochaetaceae bacterium]